MRNTENAKILPNRTSTSRVSRILSANSTFVFPGRLNRLSRLESTLTIDSTLRKFDRLDRPTRSISGSTDHASQRRVHVANPQAANLLRSVVAATKPSSQSGTEHTRAWPCNWLSHCAPVIRKRRLPASALTAPRLAT